MKSEQVMIILSSQSWQKQNFRVDLAKGPVFADPLLWQMMSHQEKKNGCGPGFSWFLRAPQSVLFISPFVLSWVGDPRVGPWNKDSRTHHWYRKSSPDSRSASRKWDEKDKARTKGLCHGPCYHGDRLELVPLGPLKTEIPGSYPSSWGSDLE